MTPELMQYLEAIRFKARLEGPREKEVLDELKSHFEESIEELTERGLSEEEAVQACLDRMGSPKLVAKQIYEAYSQGSWVQVLLVSMPHVLFGGLFALNWWHHIGWVSAMLVLVLAITVYGWWHGRPAWIFSWLSYCLLPVLAVGIMLLYLPRGWSFLAIPVYLIMASWWLFRIIVQATRRDWLFGSLVLLPLPIVIGWYLAVFPGGKFTAASLPRVHAFAPWIGLSFIALAATMAAFVRIRQRWLRVCLLATSGLMTLTLVTYYSFGRLNTFTFLGLVLVMWGIFLLPPLLERQLRKRRLLPKHGEAPARE